MNIVGSKAGSGANVAVDVAGVGEEQAPIAIDSKMHTTRDLFIKVSLRGPILSLRTCLKIQFRS